MVTRACNPIAERGRRTLEVTGQSVWPNYALALVGSPCSSKKVQEEYRRRLRSTSGLCVHTCKCTHPYTQAHIHACIHTHVHTYTHVFTHTYSYTHTLPFTHAHTCTKFHQTRCRLAVQWNTVQQKRGTSLTSATTPVSRLKPDTRTTRGVTLFIPNVQNKESRGDEKD